VLVFPDEVERQIKAFVTDHEQDGVALKIPGAIFNVKFPIELLVTEVSHDPDCRVIVQGDDVQVVNSLTAARSIRSSPELFDVTEPARRGAGKDWSRAMIVHRM
jgi:hypothetical protein